jgi:hypothetical protein
MIAGIGFARMAWELAKSRTYDYYGNDQIKPATRSWANVFTNSPTAEYYRIIDRAWSEWNVHPMLRKTLVHL